MSVIVRRLGVLDYARVVADMQSFTLRRDQFTPDELWIVEHSPVFTLGLNGQRKHLLAVDSIPVIETDRGGQVTFHAPGQLVVYCLLDIQRLQLGVRQLVTLLEEAMIHTLAQYGVLANSKPEAPGVYVADQKIGSVGLRIKKGCSYHGLSLNNQLDLTPFKHINPCGYPGLEITQLADLGVDVSTFELAVPVVHSILQAIKK